MLQTLGVVYRVSQRRESDTRPVSGDNEETEAQPQSHMKGIFGSRVEVPFPWSPSTLCHKHTHTHKHNRHHTQQHTLLPCLSLYFTHMHMELLAPFLLLLSLILTKTKQVLGSCDTVAATLSLCVFLAVWLFLLQLSQTVYHP